MSLVRRKSTRTTSSANYIAKNSMLINLAISQLVAVSHSNRMILASKHSGRSCSQNFDTLRVNGAIGAAQTAQKSLQLCQRYPNGWKVCKATQKRRPNVG